MVKMDITSLLIQTLEDLHLMVHQVTMIEDMNILNMKEVHQVMIINMEEALQWAIRHTIINTEDHLI